MLLAKWHALPVRGYSARYVVFSHQTPHSPARGGPHHSDTALVHEVSGGLHGNFTRLRPSVPLRLLTAFGHCLQEMAPGTIVNPDGLPSCGELASGPCRGDGTTLKEQLEALPTVGTINVTGISNSNKTVGDDVGICDLDGVSHSEKLAA